MKSKFFKFFSIVMAVVMLAAYAPLLVNAAEQGTKYYVDSINGDNTNPGISPDQAWKSVEWLSDVNGVGPGDSLLFKRGGEYKMNMTFTDCAGTKENPVRISAYGEGAKPLIRGSGHRDVLRLFDCSYVEVSELEITAHDGGGIWIDALTKESKGITLKNLTMHDMQNHSMRSRDNLSAGAAYARACVIVKSFPARSRFAVNDLSVTGCEMYDVGNGISVWGSWNEQQDNSKMEKEDIDPVYNEGLLIKDCYFHDMDAEAVVVGICDGALITNCRMINCCQGTGLDETGKILYFTAAAWFWGSENSTFQYCEIAGQKNYGDGMTVDFDSQTNNCTYQYIYSHDNVRFIVGNAKSDYGQHNNTVRYCLSVNDNKGRNLMSSGHGEYNFKFYNNTIINSQRFDMRNLHDSAVFNNIFTFESGYNVDVTRVKKSDGNMFSHNCFYNNVLTPGIFKNSFNTLPGFTGGEGAAAYTLSKDSPLVGSGLVVKEPIPNDFFGGKIESANIGCYAGGGSDAPYEKESFSHRLTSSLKNLRLYIISELARITADYFEDQKNKRFFE